MPPSPIGHPIAGTSGWRRAPRACDRWSMRQPDSFEVQDETLRERALWMLGVSLMVGVVVVAGLATAAIAVRAAV